MATEAPGATRPAAPGAGAGLRLVPYTPDWAARWDAFVDASQNGTIYHTRRFLAYHPADRFADASLLAFEDGRLVAVVPAAVRRQESGRALSIHPGASYGGPVLAPGTPLPTAVALIAALVAFAEDAGCRRVEMLRLPPRVYHTDPSDELELALSLHGFRLARRELSAAVPIPPAGSPVAGLLSEPCARAVRKAARAGLEVRFTNDPAALAAFWAILETMLAARHATHPTHSLAEITALATDLCPERVRLLGAYDGARLVGGVVVFTASRRALYTMYIAQDYAFQALRPTNLILFRLLEWAQAHGFATVDLGVCTEGESVNWSLYRFKESLGARGSLRDTYVRDA